MDMVDMPQDIVMKVLKLNQTCRKLRLPTPLQSLWCNGAASADDFSIKLTDVIHIEMSIGGVDGHYTFDHEAAATHFKRCIFNGVIR